MSNIGVVLKKELNNLKERIVRIQKMELNNLKNVGKGTIKFACNMRENIFEDKSDILAIYGQNGSGKTTAIYAIQLFKNLLTGRKLEKDCANYIKVGTKSASCLFQLSVIDAKKQEFKIAYEFELKIDDINFKHNELVDDEHLDDDRKVYVSSEKISLSRIVDGKWTKRATVMGYSDEDESVLFPKVRYNQIVSGDKGLEDELRVTKLLIKKSSRSFLFSSELFDIIRDSRIEEEYKNVFVILQEYAAINLHVISNTDSGIINANIALPLSFVLKEKDSKYLLKGSLNLNGTSRIPREFFDSISDKMKTINMVLQEIIPGLTIRLKHIGIELDKDSDETVLVQIIAKRGNTEVPLRYESDGIKKLLSILYGLIMVFNNSSTTLAVDEFDSGIFEYLLGEILKIVEEHGRGQIIFTSHNLRPLEVLNKRNIMFTTTNENNRYIRMKNVKTNNNFRDLYFHDIILGGQNECIYETTNPYMIRRAFRLAGDEDDR